MKLSIAKKWAIRILLISILAVLLSLIIIETLFYFEINSEVGETIYGICYIIGFISIFIFFLSILIILSIQVLQKFKK